MGEQVYVYWNLHKNLYSVRRRGLVQRHSNYVQLRNVTFAVGEAGRKRVLREKRKHVHAGVRGVDCSCEPAFSTRGWRKVMYDPYRFDSFVAESSRRPVLGASQVVGAIVDGRARLWARGLVYRQEGTQGV